MVADGRQIVDEGDVPVPLRGVTPHVFIHANHIYPFKPCGTIDR